MKKLIALSLLIGIIIGSSIAYSAVTYTISKTAMEQLTINMEAVYDASFNVTKYRVNILGISHATDQTGQRYPITIAKTYTELPAATKTQVAGILTIMQAANQAKIGEATGSLPPLE